MTAEVMNVEEEIRKVVHNSELAQKEINTFPQTYSTLLKSCKDNKTWQVILRRKLNNLWKDGWISKITIPGTRFGMVVFTSKNKKYDLLVEDSRVGVNVYCFFQYSKPNPYALELSHYWKLDKDCWREYNKSLIISKGSILKWI